MAVQGICRLADSVLVHGALILLVVQVVRVDAAGRSKCLGHGAGEPDDPHGGGRPVASSREKGRGEELCEEEGSQGVGAELELVALSGGRAAGRHHDARVVPEHVELGLLGEEGVGGFFDPGEVVEVQVQVLETAAGSGVLLFDLLHCAVCPFGRASGNVDLGVGAVEVVGKLLSDATGCAGNDEYLLGGVKLYQKLTVRN